MDSKEIKKNLHQAFAPYFAKMCRRYTNHQMKILTEDSAGKAAAVMRYVAEFADAGITPAHLHEYADTILEARDYAARPPAPREFVFALKDRADSSCELSGDLGALFDRLRARYRQLWSPIENKALVVDDICQLLEGNSITSEDVRAGEMRIVKDPEYRSYPPTPSKVAESILIVSKDPSIPTVSQAYMEAVRRGDDKHPLIRAVRSIFGAHGLRTRTDYRVKQDFEELYAAKLSEFAEGRFKLPAVDADGEHNPASKGAEEAPLAANELTAILRG